MKLDKQPFEIDIVKMITYNGGFFDWVSKTSFFIKRIWDYIFFAPLCQVIMADLRLQKKDI